MKTTMRSLIYTIAFDCPGSETYQTMARLLALSLRESGYDDEILVLTNRSSGVFRHGRYGIREIVVETGGLEPAAVGVAAKEHKFRIAPWIDTSDYDQIFYIDCDSLALSNPAERLFSDKEISCAAESWGRITDNPFNSYFTNQENVHAPAPADQQRSVSDRWKGSIHNPRESAVRLFS